MEPRLQPTQSTFSQHECSKILDCLPQTVFVDIPKRPGMQEGKVSEELNLALGQKVGTSIHNHFGRKLMNDKAGLKTRLIRMTRTIHLTESFGLITPIQPQVRARISLVNILQNTVQPTIGQTLQFSGTIEIPAGIYVLSYPSGQT